MGIKYSYSSSIISLYELFQAPLFIFYRVSFLVWSLSRIHSRVRSTSRCAVRFPAHSLAPILESILILSQGMRIGGCAKKDQSETSQSPAFNRFLHGGRFRGIYTGITLSKTSGRSQDSLWFIVLINLTWWSDEIEIFTILTSTGLNSVNSAWL